MIRKCKIKNCDRAYHATGQCKKHYDKARTYLSRTYGTIEYFCTRMWCSIKTRLKVNKNYENIKLCMTKDDFYTWYKEQHDKVSLPLMKAGEKPSLDRIDNKGHYSLDNIQIISLSENIAKDQRKAIRHPLFWS